MGQYTSPMYKVYENVRHFVDVVFKEDLDIRKEFSLEAARK